MSQQHDAFRDFGIFPQGLPAPPEKVRCFLSTGRIIGQYFAVGVGALLGLGLGVLFALALPFPLNWLGGAATLLGFAALLFLATHNDYGWAELDGKTIRAKHLYTGHVMERSVDEVESLATMFYQHRSAETAIIESMFGRIKGIEIRFRDQRCPLRIMRADPTMTHAKEFMEALVFRMTQLQKVDAEIVQFAGVPLVKRVYWKGEQPAVPSGKNLKVILCCLILMGLMFGPILGFWGLQEQRLQILASIPPHELTLQTLIENGPGATPHIALTEFQFGGYVVETNNGSWSRVWIALFPRNNAVVQIPQGPPARVSEVKAIFESREIHSEAELRQFVQRKRLTGICAVQRRTNFGLTLGPELIKANPGSSLTSAFVLEDTSAPPSAAMVWWIFAGSLVSFAFAILCALLVVVAAT